MNELHRLGTPPRGRVDQISHFQMAWTIGRKLPGAESWVVYAAAMGLAIIRGAEWRQSPALPIAHCASSGGSLTSCECGLQLPSGESPPARVEPHSVLGRRYSLPLLMGVQRPHFCLRGSEAWNNKSALSLICFVALTVFDSKTQVKPRSEEGQNPNFQAEVLSRTPEESVAPLQHPWAGACRLLALYVLYLPTMARLATLTSSSLYAVTKTCHLHVMCPELQVW